MEYIDFHTHLDFYSQEKLFPKLKDYTGTIIGASVDLESYKKNVAICEKAKALGYSVSIIPTLGIHPMKAQDEFNGELYSQALKQSKIIGEIGMDFCWYKSASPQRQEQVFRFFLDHCNKYKKYCVIHTKDAEKLIADILLDYPDAKPIIHWYDGPEDIYKEFLKRGYMQTFGCQTIRSEHIQKLLKITPHELILAETDNPESEPWLGGNDNSPQLIERIYKDIAQILNLSLKDAVEIINENAHKIITTGETI